MIAGPLLAVAAVIWTEFLAYQPRVEQLIASLPAAERDLPPAVAAVFSKLDDTQVNRWVARNLLWTVTERTGMGRWHLRFALWELLLPSRYSRNDRLSLFAHFLVAERASGLEQVSRTVFGKSPRDLTPDDAFGLLAVLRGPRRFSPQLHRDAYERERERIRRELGAV